MKKIGYFILLALCVMGAIGGVGYSLYCEAYPIAAGVVVLGLYSEPLIRFFQAVSLGLE